MTTVLPVWTLGMALPKHRHKVLTRAINRELDRANDSGLMYNTKEDEGLLYKIELNAALIAHDEFSSEDLDEFSEVIPDIMLFHQNSYALSKVKESVAGFPDLVIEVWSNSNSDMERNFKRVLYSTGIGTEHWYLTQTSNVVECWFESEKLPDQSLENILITKNGIHIDLRSLSLAD
ncbi:MAG: Uma2 family endonuclease [Turicibacter sp.]|nr:Uma2 family endonuclease [Turicibacter sp.]